MRELPPSPVTGPTLVYKCTKRDQAGFYCSRCGVSFATADPVEAFHSFAQHQHRCIRQRKPQRKIRFVS